MEESSRRGADGKPGVVKGLFTRLTMRSKARKERLREEYLALHTVEELEHICEAVHAILAILQEETGRSGDYTDSMREEER